MCSLLAELSRSGALPRSVLAFEVKLLGLLGLKPDTAETRLTAGSRLLLEHFACDDWRALAPVRLSTAQVAELRQFLHGFLVYHLGKIPAGRSAALLAHG